MHKFVQLRSCDVVKVIDFDVNEKKIQFDTHDEKLTEKLNAYTSTYFDIANDDATFATRVIGSRLAVYDNGEIEEIDDFEKFQMDWQTKESFRRMMEVQCMIGAN